MPGSALLVLSTAVLVSSLCFGGGTQRGLIADLVPQLLSVALLAIAAPRALPGLFSHRLTFVLLACIGLVALLQFVPLPISAWGALPGRGQFLEAYAAAGVEPAWLPVSLSPGEALRSVFALLPAIALLLAVMALDSAERKTLVAILLGIAGLSVLMGMLQVLGGASNPLYLHSFTNVGRGVGFFANANHYAALFYASAPFAIALLASRRPVAGVPTWVICAGVLILFVLGLALSGSRTALVLGAASLLAGLAWIARETLTDLMRGRAVVWTAAAVSLLLLPALMGAGLLAILERFDSDALSNDVRWTINAHSLEVARAFWPVGAGLGSFVRVYQWSEPVQSIHAQYVNQAHNDWLQIVLETGAVGLLAGALFAIWFARELARRWSGERDDARLRKAALIAIGLLALHSFWDYPLRTTALLAVFGMACGLTCPPAPPRAARVRSRSSRRHSP